MYLFDEHPIIANKTLAREIGLNEALVLQQINYWIEINRKTGKNFYEGRYWTYNSIRSWQENDFDYMSFETVKRTFTKLEKQGYLITGNFNKDPRDKTKWYSINEDRLNELYLYLENKKRDSELLALSKNVDNSGDVEVITNALGQNDLMEQFKMTQCKSADCTNAFMQNDLMQEGKMHQPLPEITTNNTTEITSDISEYPSVHPSIKLSQKKDIDNINISSNTWKEGMTELKNKKTYKDYLEILRQNTGYYEHLEVGNKTQAKDIDDILTVLADVMVLDDDDYVKINQTNMKVRIVRERYLSLKYEHLDHLIRVLVNHDEEVRNIRAFILTSAFNVSATINSFYTNRVSYDMKHW